MQIPTPEVSLKKALYIRDIPLSYMFPLASSLCPEQYCCFVEADIAIRGLSCPFFCSASSQVLDTTHMVSFTPLHRASAPKPSPVPYQ